MTALFRAANIGRDFRFPQGDERKIQESPELNLIQPNIPIDHCHRKVQLALFFPFQRSNNIYSIVHSPFLALTFASCLAHNLFGSQAPAPA